MAFDRPDSVSEVLFEVPLLRQATDCSLETAAVVAGDEETTRLLINDAIFNGEWTEPSKLKVQIAFMPTSQSSDLANFFTV